MKTSRLFLIAGILVLITLACKAPFLSQFQMDADQADDDSGTSETSLTTSDESDTLTPHNTDGADVTSIPGATYQMGSLDTDPLADKDEFPQHQLTISDFYIYTYEVTNEMYNVCVEAGYCMRPQMLEEGPTSHYEDPEYAEFPVVGVDWVMARDYCAWAGARLPTEAEWELVSRGPDSLYYPWGEKEPTCDHVNMKGCYTPKDTQKVGYYLLGNSPYEVWDMSGNVWEWVHDWYGEDYYSISPEDNPIGPLEPDDPDKPLRVIRGGGLNSDPDKMRSASRMGLNPYRVFIDVGFRCVVGVELLFPAGYDHGHDRHERVPPDSADGGDSADDDDGFDRAFFWAGPTEGPCPDPFGDFTLTFRAGASIPVDNVYAWIDDFPFDMDCDYDPILEIVSCTGHIFSGYLEIPPPSTPISICFDHTEGRDCIEVLLWKPTDCDDGGLEGLIVEAMPSCLDPETALIVIRIEPAERELSFAATDTALLHCIALGGGLYRCSDLPGSPGEMLEIHINLADGTVVDRTVEHYNCSPSFIIEPLCLDVEGVSTPVLRLIFPVEAPGFLGATANGTDLFCVDVGGNIFECIGLPGGHPDDLEVIASFASGATLTGSAVFPLCGTSGFDTPWELVEVGCFYPTPTTPEYYAVIDTFLGDAVEFTGYRLETVQAPKTCAPYVLPSPPDRYYCNFAIRDWYTEMTFCATWVGGPGEYCETFTGLDTMLPARCPVDTGDGEPETGYCIVASPGSCGTNPCRPTCNASGPNETCIPCTMP